MKRKSIWKKSASRKMTAVLLGAAMLLGCAACSSEKAAEPAESPQADTKEAASAENTDNAGEQALDYVELQMYAIADAPNNTDLAKQYWEQLNTRLKEELNCTINYTYAAGNDYKNNYALAIASGEKYDLMQAAPGWLDYQTYAAKNAFMPLDDLLPQYAPICGKIFRKPPGRLLP